MIVCSIDPGLQHLSFCVFDATAMQLRALEVSRVDKANLISSVLQLLQSKAALLTQCRVVLIERQHHQNAGMMRLQGALEMFCAQQGLQVSLCSAALKLKGTTALQGDSHALVQGARSVAGAPQRTAAGSGTSRKPHKKESVSRTANFLARYPQPPSIMAAWDQADKKDDLADCVLQALAHCRVGLLQALAHCRVGLGDAPGVGQQADDAALAGHHVDEGGAADSATAAVQSRDVERSSLHGGSRAHASADAPCPESPREPALRSDGGPCNEKKDCYIDLTLIDSD